MSVDSNEKIRACIDYLRACGVRTEYVVDDLYLTALQRERLRVSGFVRTEACDGVWEWRAECSP